VTGAAGFLWSCSHVGVEVFCSIVVIEIILCAIVRLGCNNCIVMQGTENECNDSLQVEKYRQSSLVDYFVLG